MNKTEFHFTHISYNHDHLSEKLFFFLREIQSSANSMSCSNFVAIQCQDKFPTDKVSVLKHKSCTYQGVKNVRFLKNLAYFVFLKHLFRDSPFYLITDKISDNKYHVNNILFF